MQVTWALSASFEGRGRKCLGEEGNGGKGERRESLSLVYGSWRNQQGKEMEDLCDNFTILPFFSLKINTLCYTL